MSKQAKVDVIINKEQAQAHIKDLQNSLDVLKQKRMDALDKGNADGVKLYNAEIKKVNGELTRTQQKWVEVDKVLSNLSGASMRELNSAIRQASFELTNMKRNTPEWDLQRRKVEALSREHEKATASFKGNQSSLGALVTTAGGWIASLGLATGGMQFLQKVISVTDSVSDKFNETIGGMRSGTDYLARSIATLDFSNFLTNMREAIKAGKDYISALDQIGDKQRALTILESRDRKRIAELKVITDDVTKSKDERIKASNEVLDIEKKNADRRIKLATETNAIELQEAARKTGLSEKRVNEMMTEALTQEEVTANIKEYLSALQTVNEYQASRGSLGGWLLADKNAAEEAMNIIQNAPQTIKNSAKEWAQFASVNEEVYDGLVKTMSGLAAEEASYDENNRRIQARRSKLLKGQIDDEENATEKQLKNARNTKTEYEKLSESISKLTQKAQDYLAAGKQIPDALKLDINARIAQKKAIDEVINSLGKLDMTVSENTQMEWIATEQRIIDNEARRIANKLIQDEAEALLLLSDAQHQAYIQKVQDSKIKIAIDEDKNAQDQDKKDKEDEEKLREKWKDALYDMAANVNTTVFNIVKDRQQAEFDHKIALLNKQREIEVSNKNLTEEQKAAIDAKYDKKIKAVKLEAWKKERNATALNTAIATILAVMKAGGPLDPVGAATAVAGALAVAEILAKKPPEFMGGGYTGKSNSDNDPQGVVHANEFVGSAAAVRNPSVKRVFDIIDYAQRNGTVSQIDLPALVATTTYSGRKAGGYASSSTSDNSSVQNAGFYSSFDITAIAEFNALLKQAVTDGLNTKLSLFDLEKMQAKKDYITAITKM